MAKMGRPKNYTTDEIKEIIDEYVVFTQGLVIINASRVAEYARDRKGIKKFQYYVINRNEECKQYIEELNARIRENPGASHNGAITSFQPIDIDAYTKMSTDKLKIALNNLNTFMEKMADNNYEIQKQKEELRCLLDKKNLEIISLKDELDRYKCNEMNCNEEQKAMIEDLKKQIKILSKEKESRDVALKLLWNEEGENILKEEGVFEKDGKMPDPEKTIMDADESIGKVIKNVKTLDNSFMERLRKL